MDFSTTSDAKAESLLHHGTTKMPDHGALRYMRVRYTMGDGVWLSDEKLRYPRNADYCLFDETYDGLEPTHNKEKRKRLKGIHLVAACSDWLSLCGMAVGMHGETVRLAYGPWPDRRFLPGNKHEATVCIACASITARLCELVIDPTRDPKSIAIIQLLRVVISLDPHGFLQRLE